MSEKKQPTLPQAVAEKYNCTVVPCEVIIQHPKEVADKYDLRKISLADAEKLAKAGKYLVAKSGLKESK